MTIEQLLAFVLNRVPEEKRVALAGDLSQVGKRFGWENISTFVDEDVQDLAKTLLKQVH